MRSSESHPTDQALGEVHGAIVQKLLATGKCPGRFQLANDLKTTPDDVEARLRGLEKKHGIVLHPHEPEPWVIAPFSTTPTLHWVDAGTRSWWAPCIWCALGIAALASGHVQIHTRIGAEGKPVVIDVEGGHPSSAFGNLLVHFSVPPKSAWDNVHKHCALILVFESVEDVFCWGEAHGHPVGELVPMRQVAHLARLWYRTHANTDWRKWSVGQAQDIFQTAGLTSDFWQLEGDGTY
jgi:Alkylmercury lyase